MRRIPSMLVLATLSLLTLGCPAEEDPVGVRRPSSASPKPSPSSLATAGQNVGGAIKETGEATPTPSDTIATPSPSPTPTRRPLFEPGGPDASPEPTPTPSVDPEEGSVPY